MVIENDDKTTITTDDEQKVLVQIRFEVSKSCAEAFDRRAELDNRNRTGQMKELFEVYAGKQTRSPF